MGVVTDPSGAKEGLQQVEQAAEQAAKKAASSAAKAADSVVSETDAAAQKAAAKVKTASSKSEKETSQAGQKIKKSSQETADKVSQESSRAAKSTQEAAQQTKDKVTALLSAGQVAIGNLISQCVSRVLAAGKSLVQTGISYNAEIEKYRTALTNLLGDAEKADAALAAMQADAARTPFDTATLVKSNQYLISAGENAEYSRKTILALGDAVAATGGGSAELERMAQNLQQVANQGKASSVDVKQFAMAGINIYQVLADYTGKTVQQVQGMTITYDVLTKALQAAAEEGGRYYNSMATQSQTFNGLVSTLKDNVTQLVGVLNKDLTDSLKGLTAQTIGWVQELKAAFEQDGVSGMADVGGRIISEIVSGITAQIPQLMQKAVDTVQGFAQYLQKNMSAIFASGENLLFALYDGIVAALPQIINAAIDVAASFETELIAHYDEFMVKGYEILGKIIAGLLNCLGHLLSTIADISEAAVQKIFETDWLQVGKDMVSAIADGILAGLPGIQEAMNALMRIVNPGAAAAANAALEAVGGSASPGGTGTDYHTGSTKDDNYWKNYGNKLAAQYGINTKSGGTGAGSGDIRSSLTGNSGGTTSGKSSKSKKTETVLCSTSSTHTATSQNELGNVETETKSVLEHIRDSSGKEFDRLTETITATGREMVNGVATEYTLVTKKVDGQVKKTTKTYADMSQVLEASAKKISTDYKNGATVTTEEVTKTYADGSHHIQQTVTETGERIVNGAAETYTQVTTYIDGVKDKVEETSQQIDQSVSATQKRIDEAISGASSELSSGIFGNIKDAVTAIQNKDWAGIAQSVAKLIWGEVDQKQREIISTWAKKALEAVNEAYAGGGMKKAFSALQNLLGEGLVNGSGEKLDGVNTILKGLSGAGGINTVVSSVLSGVGKIGTAISGLVGKVVGLISAHPAVFAIIALVSGIAGLGLFLWKKYGSKGSGTADGSTASEAPALPHPDSSGYIQSDTITAAELTRRTQAASAANQQNFARTQSGTGNSTAQQLNASYTGTVTAFFNVDGREMARVTAAYTDEELGFRR